jgi:hypothetical protein
MSAPTLDTIARAVPDVVAKLDRYAKLPVTSGAVVHHAENWFHVAADTEIRWATVSLILTSNVGWCVTCWGWPA